MRVESDCRFPLSKAHATVEVNSKGQITLPREVRDQVGMRAGTVVRVQVVDGRLLLDPRPDDLMALAGMITADRHVTLEEMEEAIMAGACGEPAP